MNQLKHALEVQDRDVIKIGNHLIACGNIERNDAEQMLWKYGVPHLIYVDPPWGKGHYRFWYTHAHLEPSNDYSIFLDYLFRTFDLCKGEVFMEMGNPFCFGGHFDMLDYVHPEEFRKGAGKWGGKPTW